MQVLSKPAPFLVARNLEAISRILVLAAGAPIPSPAIARGRTTFACRGPPPGSRILPFDVL
jgi:hypothetical protein